MSSVAGGADTSSSLGCIRLVWMSSEGSRIVTGTQDGIIRVWDAASGRCFCLWIDRATYFPQLPIARWPPNSRRQHGGSITVWDATTAVRSPSPLSGEPGMRIAFSPDRRRILTGGSNHVRIWTRRVVANYSH